MAYVMEAVENWDAPNVADFAADTFPFAGHSSLGLLGRAYDPVRRKIMYCNTLAPVDVELNPTGFTLWDGAISRGPADMLSISTYLNFSVMELDVDTKVVVAYDGYDPASTVPIGIDGSDGTWRRMIGSLAQDEQTPAITDPRTGNYWCHTDASCKIYCFRFEDDYALTLSPYVGTSADHFELFGLTDDWCYVGDEGVSGFNKYSLELIPRLRTADETAADYLLSYAEFEFPYLNDDRTTTTCLTTDGHMFAFTLHTDPTWSYNLYEFTPPVSAPFGGPVVGGGWADVTPWAAGTGPNTDAAPFFRDNDDNTAVVAMALKNDDTIVLLNTLYDAGDYYVYQLQCTYYRPSDATWDYQGAFITGLMDADWQPVDKDSPELASWAFDAFQSASNPMGTGFRPLDTWRDYNSFDYGDDDTERWFYFDVVPVVAGVPQDGAANYHGILAKYRFAFGVAPELVTVIDTVNWDVLYPTYAAAIGNTNVVENSMKQTTVSVVGSPNAKDVGIFDADTSAFWFCGQNDNFYQFDAATFANREAGGINPPAMRLTFGSTPPVPGARRVSNITINYVRRPPGPLA